MMTMRLSACYSIGGSPPLMEAEASVVLPATSLDDYLATVARDEIDRHILCCCWPLDEVPAPWQVNRVDGRGDGWLIVWARMKDMSFIYEVLRPVPENVKGADGVYLT